MNGDIKIQMSLTNDSLRVQRRRGSLPPSGLAFTLDVQSNVPEGNVVLVSVAGGNVTDLITALSALDD